MREIALLVAGVEIPASVVIGSDFHIAHRGLGTVVHPRTSIGSRVTIYQQVTIGRKDGHIPPGESDFEGIEIGDDVVIYPGARILGGAGVTRIGNRSIIAANAVVTQSVGDDEIWAGVPARRVRKTGQEL